MVNGSARCLNTLYVNDLNVSGTTSFATIAVTGDASIGGHLTVGYSNTSQDSQISTHGVISDRWFRSIGNVGWFSQTHGGGIWMKDVHFIRTFGSRNFFVENGDFYVGPTTTDPTATDAPVFYFKRDGSLYASNIKAGSGRISNLFVENELRALRYNIQTIADLGGTFIVAPTLNCSNTATFSTGEINGNTITATISDADSINSADLGGATWKANSKIKVSGKIGGVVIVNCEGTLTSQMNTTAGTLNFTFTYTSQTANINSLIEKHAYAANEVEDLKVMLVTVGATNPVGIYMTSYDANKMSHISLYGGANPKPTVRIGNLQGLDPIAGVDPDSLTNKWGIYTSNGFFKGTIAAERGVIGSNATVTNNWQIGDRSIWYGNATPGASSSSLVISTGTASTNSIAGSGTSSKTWMIAAGTNFGVTNTGAMYATGANVTGVLNATTGTFGNGTYKITVGNGGTANSAIRYGMTALADTTHDGFYIGTDGIALGKGAFRVNANGSAVFKNATLGDPNAYHVGIDSDSVDIWSGVNTTATNKRAYFGANESRIGNANSGNILITPSKLEYADNNGDVYFSVVDARYGETITTHVYSGGYGVSAQSGTSSTTYDIELPYIASSLIDVDLDGAPYSYSFTAPSAIVTITNLPTSGFSFQYTITYETKEKLQSFTFGDRIDEASERGVRSFSSGYNHLIQGKAAAAFGNGNQLYGKYSFSAGSDNKVQGVQSVAFGKSNYIRDGANNCFAVGTSNEIYSDVKMGVALNCGNKVVENYQTVVGKYNAPRYTCGFIVGNGTSNDPSNALEVYWSGEVSVNNCLSAHASNIYLGETPSTTKTSYPILIKDAGDFTIGRIYGSHTSSGAIGIGIQGYDYEKDMSNGLFLGIQNDGQRYVSFTDNAAWRKGLGLNRGSTLTRSYANNSYVNQTNFNRLAAYNMGNFAYITGNLSLSAAMPKSSDWTTIGSFPIMPTVTWYESVAGCGAGSNIPALGVQITTSGAIQIYNYSNTSAPSGAWYRFTAIIPIE